MKHFITICLLGILLPVFAASENYQFDDPERRKLFNELTAELRCPMCQNQNIADSDAMIARDLRRKVYQLLKQGKSREEVLSYMKDRYGDFISYQPPVTPITMWLWLLPILFVIAAAWWLAKRQPKEQIVLDESKLKEAEALLEADSLAREKGKHNE